MDDSAQIQDGTVQTSWNPVIQSLAGLLIGGALAAAAVALSLQLRPSHKTPTADAGAPSAVATAKPSPLPPTGTPSPTETPTTAPTDTPVPAATQAVSAATESVAAAPVLSQSGLPPHPGFDPSFLPPPPAGEAIAEEEAPEEPPAEPVETTAAVSVPEIPLPEPTATTAASEPPAAAPAEVPPVTPSAVAATEPPTQTPTPAATLTSAFIAKARVAQTRAEEAQEAAEERQADRYAPTEFQEGLRLYTLGLESSERERYQTAAKRFTEAAGAFIQSGSTALRIRTAQEARSKARELVDQARRFVERKAYQQAEQAYLAYLEKVPLDAQVSLEYGEMLIDRLSYSRGIQYLSQTLRMPSLLPVQRARIHWRFAEGHRRSGNLPAAIQEIRLAIQDDPQNSSYVTLLNQYQYEASAKQQAQKQRQGFQQRVIQDLTGSVLDSLIH